MEEAFKDLDAEYYELKEEDVHNKNLIQQHLEELNKEQKEIRNLSSELNLSKESSRLKDIEYQNNITITSRTYIEEVSKLQNKTTELELKENKLQMNFDTNDQEFKKCRDNMNSLEEENHKLLKATTDIKNNYNTIRRENEDLKSKITKLEREKKECEYNLNILEREYADHKLKLDKVEKYHYETSNSNEHFEKKIIALEEEIQNYENLLRENKQRFERERNGKIEDINKFIEDNQVLREELHQLKEDLNKTSKNLTLKEDEIMILRGHIEKKTNLSQRLSEENRIFKQKCDELNLIKEQIDKFKYESQTMMSDNPPETKSASIKNNHLFTTPDNDISETLFSLREIQNEKVDLYVENQKLRKNIESLDCELKGISNFLGQKEAKLGDTLQQNENITKHVLQLSRDLEELSNEHRKLMDENIQTSKNEEELRKDVYYLYREICSKIKNVFGNVDQILKTSENELLISKKLREVIQSPENLEFSVTTDRGLEKISSITNHLMNILVEEFENLLKICVDLKQDLTISNHRMHNFEKKCLNLNTEEAGTKQTEYELRRELDQLKDEKLLIQMDRSTTHNRESKIEKENNELKKELKIQRLEFQQYKEKVNPCFGVN